MNLDDSFKQNDINNNSSNGAESNSESNSSRQDNLPVVDSNSNCGTAQPAANAERNLSDDEKIAKITDKAISNNRIRSYQAVNQNNKEELMKAVSASLYSFVNQEDSLWLVTGELVWTSLQKINKLKGGAYNEDLEGKGVMATIKKIAVRVNDISVETTGIPKDVKNLTAVFYEYSRIYGKLIGEKAGGGPDKTVRLKRTVLFEKYRNLPKTFCREAITRADPVEALEIALEMLGNKNSNYTFNKFKGDIKHLAKLNPGRFGTSAETETSNLPDALTEKTRKSLKFLTGLCQASEAKIIEEAIQILLFLKMGINKSKLTLLS